MKKETNVNTDYKLEVIRDKNYKYIASYPQLPDCVGKADSLEKAVEMAQEAKFLWINKAYATGEHIPRPDDTENYSGQFKLRLPKSLHKVLSENAAIEGVSLNQYCVYILSLFENAKYPKSGKKRNYYL